jgi:hypothetical protein
MTARKPFLRRTLSLVVVCCGAWLLTAGCKTIREETQPLRETTLTVARSGDEVTLSWIGVRGMYYSVMYTDARGAKARWTLLPDAINIRAIASGEPIIVKDRVPAHLQRYYRLQQDQQPLARQ